jgi:hypothetical protein
MVFEFETKSFNERLLEVGIFKYHLLVYSSYHIGFPFVHHPVVSYLRG